MAGEYMLVLSYRRLVVIQETKVLHRLRLHLNTDLRRLSNVSWNPDLGRSALDLTATAVDGVRERFRLRLREPEAVRRSNSLLERVFRSSPAAAA